MARKHDAWTFDKVLGKSYEVTRCDGCRTLGPSNDAPVEVQIEMRAAEIDAWFTVDSLHLADECSEHELDGWRMWCSQGDLIGFVLDPAFDHIRAGVMSGWLACEASDHEFRDHRDSTAWPWDPSRPVAGQYEAWEYERQRAAEPDCRDEDEDDDTVPRKPGCECHCEEGDSPCPVHPSPDDITIRAGAPEAIGLTPRQLREQTAAGVAAEDRIREELRAGVEDGGKS